MGAHPDDEPFGLGAVLATYAQRTAGVALLTAALALSWEDSTDEVPESPPLIAPVELAG